MHRLELLSALDLGRTLDRLASQVLESAIDSRSLVLLGIPTRGVALAEVLAQRLAAMTGHSIDQGTVDPTFHRDDLERVGIRLGLPTDLPDYDQLLPRWMHCWLGTGPGIDGSGLETAPASSSGLTRNAHWDYAWLTLIARARKYCPPSPSASLFWRRLLPVLFSKALELMQIPANTGRLVGR